MGKWYQGVGLAGLSAMGTVRARAGAGPVARAADGRVHLYTAMSQAEQESLMKTGVWQPGRGTMESKWFATTAADVAKWGRQLYGDQPYRMVAVSVPEHVSPNMHHDPNLDAIGFAHCGDRRLLNQMMMLAWEVIE